MISLCSCAGKKRNKKFCEQDDDYYYIATNDPSKNDAELTPKVRRKFPEGVGLFPNIPSDLEESLVGTYKDLEHGSVLKNIETNNENCQKQQQKHFNEKIMLNLSNPESVVEHAFSFIDEEPEELELRAHVVYSEEDRESSSSDYEYGRNRFRYKVPFNYEDDSDEDSVVPDDDDSWSVTSEQLDELLTEGVHYDEDYDESSEFFEDFMNVEVQKNCRKNSCFRTVEFSRFQGENGSWDIIGEIIIISDLDFEKLEEHGDDSVSSEDGETMDESTNAFNNIRETLLNAINSKNPEILKGLNADLLDENSKQFINLESDLKKSTKDVFNVQRLGQPESDEIEVGEIIHRRKVAHLNAPVQDHTLHKLTLELKEGKDDFSISNQQQREEKLNEVQNSESEVFVKPCCQQEITEREESGDERTTKCKLDMPEHLETVAERTLSENNHCVFSTENEMGLEEVYRVSSADNSKELRENSGNDNVEVLGRFHVTTKFRTVDENSNFTTKNINEVCAINVTVEDNINMDEYEEDTLVKSEISECDKRRANEDEHAGGNMLNSKEDPCLLKLDEIQSEQNSKGTICETKETVFREDSRVNCDQVQVILQEEAVDERNSSDDEYSKEDDSYVSSYTTEDDDDSTEKLLSTDDETSSSDEEHEFIISDSAFEGSGNLLSNDEYTILEEDEDEEGIANKCEDCNDCDCIQNDEKTIEFFRFVYRKRSSANLVVSDSDDDLVPAGALRTTNGRNSHRKSVSFDDCVLVMESSDSDLEDEVSDKSSNSPRSAEDLRQAETSGWKDAAEDFQLLPDHETAVDITVNSNSREAFVIAVEEGARRRLERVSNSKRLKPVDIFKLYHQLNQGLSNVGNGYNKPPILVKPLPGANPPISSGNFVSKRPAPGIAASASGASRKPISNGHAITGAGSANERVPFENELRQNRSSEPYGASGGSRQFGAVGGSERRPAPVGASERLDAIDRSEPSGTVSDDELLGAVGGCEPYGATDESFSSRGVSNQSPGLTVPDSVPYSSASRRSSGGSRRSSSPFANGRTEVLIGYDSNGSKVRTTAVVESNRRSPGLIRDSSGRFRRRNGGGIVVVDTQDYEEPIKQKTPEEQEAEDAYNRMMTLDNTPHREMAVDVPDTFTATTKTPPRYPPPRPTPQPIPSTPTINGSAPKPVPPPRDHLKIEKDGRLVNRAPAPQVPARGPTLNNIGNNNINNNNNNNNKISAADREPTKEQLESIRKHQEALRKRKEEEERLAQQNEFLNRSLRGSRKLQALESHPPPQPPTGIVNDGYSSAEDGDLTREEVEDTLHRVIGYGELVASLQRLQLHLKRSGPSHHIAGYTSLEGQIAAVQTLLLSSEFGRSLAVHNRVQEVLLRRRKQQQNSSSGTILVSVGPVSLHAQNLVRDCLEALQPCSLPDSAELTDILTRFEIEGLLYAHDAIATQENALRSPTEMAAGSPGQEEEDTTNKPFVGEDNIKIVKIDKTQEPLGATVRNEGDAVVIGRIVRGGAAEKNGLLHEGDEVLEVNGIEMRGKTINDVCDILSSMNGTLTFLILPNPSATRTSMPPPKDFILHLRAHFDYDPEDDAYIPCRELGISFQKGDVLHVINQDDANWWQAYREGEEDQTLAGLIPSRDFQQRREQMKQSVAGDRVVKEKPSRTGILLCANYPKKKKKKALYHDGSYPLYTTQSTEDYDVEEVLTYEEVALYYPRANHKRPIVLIGPPNIGRHELRQRLMEDGERFAAAVPHTSRPKKEGEIDGHDYHFISRAQFEADILARKFVEHGEYEKAYYGTSLDAIRTVVNSGKICALNLHPQSLKILRNSDLKPYVVFVAPPSLEKLRQKKIRNGDAFKEEELKDIIEKARDMEDKYGHFFDMIIINNDTDRAFHQLLNEINILEREPQWVPASWVKGM